MTAVLQEMQFDLDGYVFGKGMPVFVDASGFDPGESVEILQDGTNPINGARTWGRDMRGPKTWTFSTHVDQTDTVTALAGLAAMGAVWQAPKWLQPQNIAMLRYRVGDRTRCVFGKPRRFSHAVNNNILGGHIPPVATFDLADHRHYDDVENVLDVTVSPTTPGGFDVPLLVPLVIELVATTVRAGVFSVGGDMDTPVMVDFIGPLTNGKVTIGSFFEVGFVGTLAAGESITVDARPWSMGVYRSGGGSVVLSRTTRLSRALVSPGTGYEAVLHGSDQSGTSKARVRWRNAYTTL